MKILCAGDYIEDFYVFGTATRLCPEAPVPVVVPQTTRTSAGGVGLVANQLRELGADVEEWRGSYSKKERIFVGSHLITRIDTDSVECFPGDFPDINPFDAIVISDYGKGAMKPNLVWTLKHSDRPLFVDTKCDWLYRGTNVTIFPNEKEFANGTYLIEDFNLVVRKRGEHGACLEAPDGNGVCVDATVKDVVDVTGAGDIFMAGFVYAWTLQCLAEDCLRFANALAGESCRFRGTHVVSREFAQSVLDRLLVSAKFERLSPGRVLDSIPEVPEQYLQLVQDLDLLAERTTGIRYGDFSQVPGDRTATGIQALFPGQIHQILPSDPKQGNDVPIPRENDTEQGNKSQSEE